MTIRQVTGFLNGQQIMMLHLLDRRRLIATAHLRRWLLKLGTSEG